MVVRVRAETDLRQALRRSPVVLIVGARQVGKTTLARTVVPRESVNYFDLEDPVDLARLSEPMLALGPLRGVVVIDEVQRHPDLFPVLRVLADREDRPATFLVLGSASPEALRQSSESLAGRIEILELPGLGAVDLDGDSDLVWLRGGYPRAVLAESDADANLWLRSYLRTLATRDLREFGLSLPAATIERFLGLVAHHQANLWNAATVARALDISESTVRRYIDGLTDAMLIRQLQPWYANDGKRLVRRPKVFFRDTGVLHALWGVSTREGLLQHFGIGASWESYVIGEIVRRSPRARHYFWRTSNGAELDLVVEDPSGRRMGLEIKRADAPRITSSVRAALEDPQLRPERIGIIYPGTTRYHLSDKVTAVPLNDLLGAATIADMVDRG
ncbi:ATP-binding protein [Salana multivorans]